MALLVKFVDQYRMMTSEQKDEFLSSLMFCLSGKNPYSNVDRVSKCPHCESQRIRKNGFYKKVQKYICNGCKKEFRPSTNTCAYYCKKPDRIKLYLKCMMEKYTISKTSEIMGVAEHLVFQWRHKLLEAMKIIQSNDFKNDAVFMINDFKYSTKGLDKRRVACVVNDDETPAKVSFITNNEGCVSLDLHLKRRLETLSIKKQVLWKTKDVTKLTFCAENVVTRATKSLGGILDKRKSGFDIRSLSLFSDKDVKVWLTKFRGVASKYLQHYLNWFVFLECYDSPREVLLKSIYQSHSVLEVYSDYKKLRDMHAFT